MSKLILYVGGEDVRMRIPLALSMRVKGFDVVIAGTESSDPFVRSDISYVRYRLERWVSPISDWRSIHELVEIFKKYKPDIVHAFDTKPAMLSMIAAQWANVPVRVRTITGVGYLFSVNSLLTYLLRPVYYFLQKKASKRSSVTIFQNPDDQKMFVNHGLLDESASRLIYGSGVDFSQYSQDAYSGSLGYEDVKKEFQIGDGPVVLMVARLVKTKGVLDYLEAAKFIKQSKPHVQFLLVGPALSEGRQAVSLDEIGRYDHCVKYLGARDDVPQIMANSSLFVLPSYYREGVPRVLLEAGAMGIPIVTTDMPGCKEVIIDGENGWLVKPRDPQYLASVMIKALEKSELELKKIGSKGVEYIKERFSLEKIADEYAGVYNELLIKSEDVCK